MHYLRRALPLAALLALPSIALAHPGHDGHEVTWDFGSGFSHPLFGLDHVLALVAVGVWAASLRGRAVWIVPGAFVTVMALGAAVAVHGQGFTGIQQGIAASIVALGLLIAVGKQLPTALAASVAGLFALFHGVAHGQEIPVNANVASYLAGIVTGTIVLHGLGLAFGWFIVRREHSAARVAGAIVALAGLALVL